ncbi:hypothetical protein IV102_29760 [bacterium]|nr:hypothetical protein [bacterium]
MVSSGLDLSTAAPQSKAPVEPCRRFRAHSALSARCFSGSAYGYKLAGNNLIVACFEKVYQVEEDSFGCQRFRPRIPANSVRQQVLLERAPAAKVIGFLQGQ